MTRIVLKRRKGRRRVTFRRKWGCPLTKNATNKCFALCVPLGGMGFCGRVAGHALTGRTDAAIRATRARTGGVGVSP
ncbi:MAG: hypothetical protein AB1486_03250 [Planctomycetota bacterium]